VHLNTAFVEPNKVAHTLTDTKKIINLFFLKVNRRKTLIFPLVMLPKIHKAGSKNPNSNIRAARKYNKITLQQRF
jgi:hypothetical protein